MSDKTQAAVTIEAVKRQNGGKTAVRKLRRAGRIPAVLNHQGKSTLLEFDPKLLSKAWKADRQFDLAFEGQTRRVKITELQLDPVKRLALHVDLAYAE